jgi:NAD(P)-dependent dehydrogenase (short-subunit alcohol dehydrogenase family)
MIRRRSGKIIMVGSGAGRPTFNRSNLIVYGVAKAAVHHMSAVLAHSVKEHGICVNAVGVSAITRLVHDHRSELARVGAHLEPLKESGPTPEENVPLFLFLASSLSDHVTGEYLEANSLSDSFKPSSP